MKWLPPNGALHGIAFDRLLHTDLAIVFWLFAASQILIVAAILIRRFSKPSPVEQRPRSVAARLLTEFLPMAAFVGLYAWMIASSHHLWAASREMPNASNAVQVEVTGVQFHWYFRYPGPDGVYGTLRPDRVNAPDGNPLGIDPQDPHGRDDIGSSILILPAGRPVDLRLRSQDVIHGFFVPGMRLKQDAIPGMPSHLRFTPEIPGLYPILCSQVCGLGHARMQARLRVLPEAAFDAWMAEREAAARSAAATAAPAASSSAGGRP